MRKIDKYTEEVYKEFGSLLTISIILSIAVNAMKLYKYCNEEEEILERFQNNDLKKIEKFSIMRSIKRKCPNLNKEERERLLLIMMEKSKGYSKCDLQNWQSMES